MLFPITKTSVRPSLDAAKKIKASVPVGEHTRTLLVTTLTERERIDLQESEPS